VTDDDAVTFGDQRERPFLVANRLHDRRRVGIPERREFDRDRRSPVLRELCADPDGLAQFLAFGWSASNSSQVAVASTMPRTYLHEPFEKRGNIHLHAAHDTSGFGADRYLASSFERLHVPGATPLLYSADVPRGLPSPVGAS
jgi:hypothetical protein